MEEKDEIVISLSDMLIRQMMMKIKTTSIYFLSKPMHRILLLHILKC